MQFQGVHKEIALISGGVAVVSCIAGYIAALTDAPVASTGGVFATTVVAHAAIQRSITYVNERYILKCSTFIFLHTAEYAVVMTALTSSCVALDIVGSRGASIMGALGAVGVLFGMYKGISRMRSGNNGHMGRLYT